MVSPKVLNKHKDKIPPNAIYIGRPSKWGNPYVLTAESNRDKIVEQYAEWLLNNPTLIEEAKNDLKGKDLVCYCAPKLCHGDILLRIANED